MQFKIFATILFTLICILPGSKAGFFDGLPLSVEEMIGSFLGFWLILATTWETFPRLKKIVITSLALLLVVQITSFYLLPYGWSVCIKSDIGINKLQSRCEPTAEDPAGIKGYIYEKIDFNNKNMPLYFFNNISFNFYEEDQPKRDTLPYVLEASTFLYSKPGDQIIVHADKKVLVSINGKTFETTGKKRETFNLIPNEFNYLSIKYETTIKKKSTLKVTASGTPFYVLPTGTVAMLFTQIYKFINIFLLTSILFGSLWSLLFKMRALERKEGYFLLCATFSLIGFFWLVQQDLLSFKLSLSLFSCIFIITSFYWILHLINSKRNIFAFLLLILFFNASILATAHAQPKETIFFKGGSDELGHESFARSTFSVTNFQDMLRATEKNSPYYYQPLHRFFLAAFHKVFDEPMWGPYVAQTLLFSLAFLFLVFVLAIQFGNTTALIFGASYFFLMVFPTTSPFALFHTPYQQAIAFSLVVLAFAHMFFLLKNNTSLWVHYFLLGLLWGAICMMRTDWIPLLLGVFIFLGVKFFEPPSAFIRKYTIFFFAIGFILFPIFIGFRNFTVAGTFIIMPTSGFVNLLPEIKTALGQSITYHEHSAIKFLTEITKVFQGNYFDLVSLLSNNIYRHIINTSFIRSLLWFTVTILSFMNLFFIIQRRSWKFSIPFLMLIFSFLPLIIENSFFGQHNGIAMFAIYDFFITLLLGINIQLLLYQSATLSFLRPLFQKNVSSLTKYYEKIF
jgi:hypothetical protein